MAASTIWLNSLVWLLVACIMISADPTGSDEQVASSAAAPTPSQAPHSDVANSGITATVALENLADKKLSTAPNASEISSPTTTQPTVHVTPGPSSADNSTHVSHLGAAESTPSGAVSTEASVSAAFTGGTLNGTNEVASTEPDVSSAGTNTVIGTTKSNVSSTVVTMPTPTNGTILNNTAGERPTVNPNITSEASPASSESTGVAISSPKDDGVTPSGQPGTLTSATPDSETSAITSSKTTTAGVQPPVPSSDKPAENTLPHVSSETPPADVSTHKTPSNPETPSTPPKNPGQTPAPGTGPHSSDVPETGGPTVANEPAEPQPSSNNRVLATKVALGVCVPLVAALIIAIVCMVKKKKICRPKRARGYETLDDFGYFVGLQNPSMIEREL